MIASDMKTTLNKHSFKWLILPFEVLVIAVLCYFPLCYRIDNLAIRQWDEARNAVHALEMLQNHNYIVRYFENKPEVWEPKPPFLIWLQVLSIKAFGINELAIRFPIIIATFLTVFLFIFYFHKYYQNRYIGYLAALVLVTSQGYIDRHIARTGDHDALLILFSTAVILYFYRVLVVEKPKPVLIMGIVLLFILGVYTKSIAIFLILPGILVSVFAFKSGKKLFFNKWFYIAFSTFVIVVGAYYLLRESMQPGYLKAVWQWELFPRYANTEGKFDSGAFWFYAFNLVAWRYTYWIYFLVLSMLVLPFTLKDSLRKYYYYLLLIMVVLFIVLSLGSKNIWYDGPLFPLFALILALFLYYLYGFIKEKVCRYIPGKQFIALAVICYLFIEPYEDILLKVSASTEYPWDMEHYAMSYWLRDRQNIDKFPHPVKVIYNGYKGHLLFYVEAANYERREQVRKLSGFSGIIPGDLVLVSQQQVMDSIALCYKNEIVFTREPVKLIKIESVIQR
jgi:4-amino-4-deoxy-L-arabinose transferase-like glycosyltransferase